MLRAKGGCRDAATVIRRRIHCEKHNERKRD
jgi:hypothetical protein